MQMVSSMSSYLHSLLHRWEFPCRRECKSSAMLGITVNCWWVGFIEGWLTCHEMYSYENTTKNQDVEQFCVCVFSRVWLFATPWTVAPGSSIRGISQVRTLERVAISFSWDLLNPGIEPDFPGSSGLAGGFFTTLPPGKPRTISPPPEVSL